MAARRRGDPKPKEGCCSNFSIFFLVIINLFVGIGGIALVAFGGYLLSNFKNFEELVSKDASIYLLCSGLILFIFSMLAIGGAITNQKKLLGVYVIVLVLIVISEVVVAIFALDYLGVIENAGEGNSLDTEGNKTKVTNSRERVINNFVLNTYHTCCVLDDAFCDNLPSEELYCEPVFTCNAPGNEFAEVCVDADDVTVVEQGVCTALQKFKNKGVALVGPSSSSCGNGDPKQFLQNFSDYFKAQLGLAGYAALVVGVLEFFTILFSMYLIFGKKVRWDRDFYGHRNEGSEVFAIAVPEPVDYPLGAAQNGAASNVSGGREGYDSVNVGDDFVMSVARAPSTPRSGVSRQTSAAHGNINVNVAGNRRSLQQSVGPFGGGGSEAPVEGSEAGRGRSNSMMTQSSISKQKMQQNPNVIDDVI